MSDDMINPDHSIPNNTTARRLARLLALTAEWELDCSTCLREVPVYVDREVAGANADREMPDLWRHLAICTDCYEEYEMLRDLAMLELRGELPTRRALLDQLDRRRDDRHE